MNFFTDLLFTQYYELKSKDRPTKSAKNTGILLLSVLIILLLVTIMMAMNAMGLLKGAITQGNGKAIGRLVGIVALAISFGALYLFFGKQEKYDAIIKSYEELSDEEQNEVYKRGMKRFFIAFIIMLVSTVVLAMV